MSYLGKTTLGVPMNEALLTITGSGASGSLTADFRTVYECFARDGKPKYARAPVMVWLAKVVVGHGGGANKDTPLFELCHLAHAINNFNDGTSTSERRMLFFLAPEMASPSVYRDWFQQVASPPSGPSGSIVVHNRGLDIGYPDGTFSITYARMPFLAALFEFLSSMDQFSFYEVLNQLLDKLSDPDATEGGVTFRQIQDASNKLSSVLRKYRREHLPRAQHDEKFDKIFKFLKGRSTSGRLQVEDKAILDFWLIHSVVEDYRIYRTVYDNFVTLLKSLEEAEAGKNIDRAIVIGTDVENDEVEPEDDAATITDYGDWQSPLSVFDQEPTAGIKFFKQKNERQPIEKLMSYGPYANELPLAFLRLEAFGPVQSGITNDLRLKKGANSIQTRMTCADAVPYSQIQKQFQSILKHVGQLQLATLYALKRGGDLAADKHETQNGNNVVSLFDHPLETEFEIARKGDVSDELDEDQRMEAVKQAEQAFKSLTRMGFTEAFLGGEKNLEAFGIGAGALIKVSSQLETFLGKVLKLSRQDSGIEDLFSQDRELFSAQFQTIYGVAQ